MYLEKRVAGKKQNCYLIENIRVGGGWKKVAVYLGSNLSPAGQEKQRRQKEPLLRQKVAAFRKQADPLLVLLTKKEEEELETLRSAAASSVHLADQQLKSQFYGRFVTAFTYNTNAIEGSTLTLLDTKLILEDNIVPRGASLKEVSEVQNHKEAFDYMFSYAGSLTTPFVLALHKKLMHNILWEQAGAFRDVQVYLSGVQKTLPPPSAVPAEIKRLFRWYPTSKKKYHPVVTAAYFHAAFESIHPFRDGNGRVGRLLLNFMLKQSGFPLVDITYKDRERYYKSLQHADTGDLRPLVDLIIRSLKETVKGL